MKSNKQQAKAAAAFARRWQGRGYEKGDSQVFWTELLAEVFGIPNPSTFIRYEEQVKVDTTNFIDAHIPSTKVLIEQKSLGRNLREPIRQSGGIELTPFEQARRYVLGLPLSQHPRYIVTCNFAEFLVYDMEQPHAEPQQIFLKDLGKEYYRLRFLVESGAAHLQREMQVSMQAKSWAKSTTNCSGSTTTPARRPSAGSTFFASGSYSAFTPRTRASLATTSFTTTSPTAILRTCARPSWSCSTCSIRPKPSEPPI